MNDLCLCYIGDEYDRTIEPYKVEVCRASKIWVCAECDEPIVKGEKMQKMWVEVNDEDCLRDSYGDVISRREIIRSHIACAGIRRDFFCNAFYCGCRQTLIERMGIDYVTGWQAQEAAMTEWWEK